MKLILLAILCVLGLLLAAFLYVMYFKGSSAPLSDAMRKSTPLLRADSGLPVYIRITKERRLLELLIQRESGWEVAKTYPILAMSGKLGPKKAEGDYQAPEGYYTVRKHSLNPNSKYHLSFNIGYPNSYDRAQGYTGSFIMVHGGCASIGCFSMGDAAIEEIYIMVEQALEKGQSFVPVQVYPFDMTEQRMKAEQTSPHYAFWASLAEGWRASKQSNAPVADTPAP